MQVYLIVADDGASWHSANEQAVWDAEGAWADGYLSIFLIDVTVFKGGGLDGEAYVTPQRLLRTEGESAHRERQLIWEPVPNEEELKHGSKE